MGGDGQPGPITDTASLLAALDRRVGSAEQLRAFDDAVWAARGAEAAILVTDLSGFTRLTKKHGIIHFLHIFRRFQRVCVPTIDAHHGALVCQDADDILGLFPTAHDAVAAALAMQREVVAINTDLEPDARVGLCVGVAHGKMLRLDDNVFGDPVNVAFKLGEDLADAGEVLVSADTFAAAVAEGVGFAGVEISDLRSAPAGGVRLEHRRLILRAGS